ncbi:beta-1,6-N-acetylglucosaminyltransferase [Psychrobacter sp. UBA3962]|uniref:beta-1,6-N-acetylglucosaminyltransferase n=1 Tax=Psychrobacter sp. UBA3962 TaxID=1947352 RepID=UPI0025E47165|nr:beta-1,6-N-acetylglucosaminyltransferase [Psychrobacter sp. UBA3962]
MKIIYAFTCHRMTNPLIHTVNYLSSFPENIILIHVDKKSNLKDFETLKNSNVYFIPNRIDITWGDETLMLATVELMRFACNFNYDYFFLLSGDDIPLKTDAELKSLLSNNSDYNFLYFDVNMTDDKIEQRVRYKHPDVFYKRDSKLITKIRKKIFHLTRDSFFKNKSLEENKHRLPKLYKGTNWFGLKASAIEYILTYINDNKWFVDLFKRSFAADEVIFHTIIKTNPEIKIFNHPDYPVPSLRYIDWRSGPEYPRVLTPDDALKMIASNCFFARKINANASSKFMNSFLNER